MNEFVPLITIILSAGSLILSLITLLDRRNAETKKAMEDMNARIHANETSTKILEERLSNEIRGVEKIDEKLDEVIKELRN